MEVHRRFSARQSLKFLAYSELTTELLKEMYWDSDSKKK